MVKNPSANAEDIRTEDLIPGLERSCGGSHSNPFQDSCLENPVVGYSPWGCKESDTTERFHFHFSRSHFCKQKRSLREIIKSLHYVIVEAKQSLGP